MKKLYLAILAFMILIPASASAQYVAVNLPCAQGGKGLSVPTIMVPGLNTPTNLVGSYPLATADIYNTGTLTHATIYSTSTGGALSNPTSCDATGYLHFFVATGTYDITFSGNSQQLQLTTPFTIPAIGVGGGGSSSVCGLGNCTTVIDTTKEAGSTWAQRVNTAITSICATYPSGTIDGRGEISPVMDVSMGAAITAGCGISLILPGATIPRTTGAQFILKAKLQVHGQLALGGADTTIIENLSGDTSDVFANPGEVALGGGVLITDLAIINFGSFTVLDKTGASQSVTYATGRGFDFSMVGNSEIDRCNTDVQIGITVGSFGGAYYNVFHNNFWGFQNPNGVGIQEPAGFPNSDNFYADKFTGYGSAFFANVVGGWQTHDAGDIEGAGAGIVIWGGGQIDFRNTYMESISANPNAPVYALWQPNTSYVAGAVVQGFYPITSVASGTGVYTGTFPNGGSNALAGLGIIINGFQKYFVHGTVTSGTLQSGETIIQSTTGASGIVSTPLATGSANLVFATIPTGSPNASSTWIGQTSGAVYTPSSLPAPANNTGGATITASSTTSITISNANSAAETHTAGAIDNLQHICITAGTSGATTPSWNYADLTFASFTPWQSHYGSSTTDNGATWVTVAHGYTVMGPATSGNTIQGYGPTVTPDNYEIDNNGFGNIVYVPPTISGQSGYPPYSITAQLHLCIGQSGALANGESIAGCLSGPQNATQNNTAALYATSQGTNRYGGGNRGLDNVAVGGLLTSGGNATYIGNQLTVGGCPTPPAPVLSYNSANTGSTSNYYALVQHCGGGVTVIGAFAHATTDAASPGSIILATIVNGGTAVTSSSVFNILTAVSGGGSAQFTCSTVVSGVCTAGSVTTNGIGYPDGLTLSTSLASGAGSGLTLLISANAITEITPALATYGNWQGMPPSSNTFDVVWNTDGSTTTSTILRGASLTTLSPYIYGVMANFGQTPTSGYTVPSRNTTADSSFSGYVNFAGGTAASSSCGSISGAAGCIIVNVGGVLHYVPYF